MTSLSQLSLFCALQGVYAVFLEASNLGSAADCFEELLAQQTFFDMYGFSNPAFHPKLILAAKAFPLNQSLGENMVRLHKLLFY